MRIDMPVKIKALAVALMIAVFISSVVFAYVMTTNDSISEDESKAFTYAVMFAAILIILNAVLLTIGLWALKRSKATSRKCVSCGAAIGSESTCSKCGTAAAEDNIYLDPRDKGNDDTIRPKV
jgi:ribosomal protein L32